MWVSATISMEMFLVLIFTFKAKHNSRYERVKSLDGSCSFYQFTVPVAIQEAQGTGSRLLSASESSSWGTFT